jgi:hypothetical protein
MDRRTFIVALVAVYGCGPNEEPKKAAEAPKSAPLAVAGQSAQPAEKLPRVALVFNNLPVAEMTAHRFDRAFVAGLRDLGLVEGRNIMIAEAAHQLGVLVFLLNPKDTRHYAKAVGLRGKTDRVDAELIARMIAHEHTKLRVRALPGKGPIEHRDPRDPRAAHRSYRLVNLHPQDRVRSRASHKGIDMNHRIFRVRSWPQRVGARRWRMSRRGRQRNHDRAHNDEARLSYSVCTYNSLAR